MEEKAEGRLRELFEKMPYPASIFLFTDEGQNVPFNQAAREVLHILHRVSRNSNQGYDLGHEQAANGRYRVRRLFSSIPIGVKPAGSGLLSARKPRPDHRPSDAGLSKHGT